MNEPSAHTPENRGRVSPVAIIFDYGNTDGSEATYVIADLTDLLDYLA